MKKIFIFALTLLLVLPASANVEELVAAAEKGDVEAQFYVGFDILEKGYPTVIMEIEYESKVSAANWFRRAAVQGHAEAQCYLGFFYYYGYGVEQDYSKAVYWFQKATDQGHAGGQYHLAVCHQFGFGVEKNIQKAKQLSDLATKGDAEAQYHIAFRSFHIERNSIVEISSIFTINSDS